MMKAQLESDSDSYRTSHSSPGYGEHYSKTYEHGYYAHQWRLIEKPLLRDVFATLKERDKIRYLDFACGTGRILGVGEEFFNDTTGVDVSTEMLRVAAQNCPKSKLIQQDITRNPIKAEYDVITAFRFFLNAEADLADEVLNEFYKLLSEENGKLIINIHVNKKSPLGIMYEFRNLITGKKLANTMRYDVFKDVLERNGFVVEKVIWYGFFPRFGNMFGEVSRYLIGPVESLFKLFPFCAGFAQCYLIQCRKKIGFRIT
jgi:SAM-dependent methyltransferase